MVSWFPLVIPWLFLEHHLQVQVLTHPIKYLNIYHVDCHKVFHRHLRSPDEEPQWLWSMFSTILWNISTSTSTSLFEWALVYLLLQKWKCFTQLRMWNYSESRNENENMSVSHKCTLWWALRTSGNTNNMALFFEVSWQSKIRVFFPTVFLFRANKGQAACLQVICV